MNKCSILLLTSLLLACVVLSGCATQKNTTHAATQLIEYDTTFHFSAIVDGSDRFVFTPQEVRYEHKFWDRASDVRFNGEPWTDLDNSPSGWRELARELDLTKARIVERSGRDVIALEQTVEGFDLYLCDSPGGAAEYNVTIVVPRRP